jgi:hypothetical protein
MNNPEIQNIHTLTWNGQNDCVFEAVLTNNRVTKLHFCEPPAKVDEPQICITSTNEHFLRQAMENLTELFSYIDKQRAATGTFRLDDIDNP